jgi:opacity protein-like surface antigen
MKGLLWCAVVAALIAPSASQAQSAPQVAELATKLLAIFQKNAPPNSGPSSVIGTAKAGNQTKVYFQQEFDRANKKSHLNHEYLCTLLDGDAGWMCAPASMPAGLILVK